MPRFKEAGSVVIKVEMPRTSENGPPVKFDMNQDLKVYDVFQILKFYIL